MDREKALAILRENIKNENLFKHSLAVEAAMKTLARYFNQDQEKWGLCGLLHDIDYEKTQGDPQKHSRLAEEMLVGLGLESEISQAVFTHNEAHGIEPQGLMAKALFVIDPLTGLIVASVLVLPSKKIRDLKAENVLKRFKEKAFAKGANRDIIEKCQDYLGLELSSFVELALQAMQEIGPDLGL